MSNGKKVRLVLGTKNKIIIQEKNGRLQGSLMIADKESLEVVKSDDAVFININIPRHQVIDGALFFIVQLAKYVKEKEAGEKKARKGKVKKADLDEILAEAEKESKSEEDIASLME